MKGREERKIRKIKMKKKKMRKNGLNSAVEKRKKKIKKITRKMFGWKENVKGRKERSVRKNDDVKAYEEKMGETER